MYTIKKLNVKHNAMVNEAWQTFLKQSDIRSEDNVDAVLGVFDGDTMIATGAYYKNILKCIAVHCDYQGGSVLNKLISALLDAVWETSVGAVYVYTKPSTCDSFLHLGFKEIARVDNQLVFLEKAVRGFDAYLDAIKKYKKSGKRIASIVMNANPFSLGHQYLVETASKQSDVVYVFVVSEDVSAFPNTIRKRLVQEGVAHLDNVVVLDTDHYMVSSQTFPSYFLNENSDVTRVQATLDATVFKNRIAPVLDINVRYVGEEPFSIPTAIYNDALKAVLEPEIELNVIPRSSVNETPISASFIRKQISEEGIESVKGLVPNTTYQFLLSDEGERIMNKLRNGGK